MHGTMHERQHFELDSLCYGEPVKYIEQCCVSVDLLEDKLKFELWMARMCFIMLVIVTHVYNAYTMSKLSL